MKLRTLGVVCAIAISVGAAALFAQTENGTITACAGRDGYLRLISASASCKQAETRIHWNIMGPKGDTGATGTPGAPGAPGTTGPQGPAGPGALRVVDSLGHDVGMFTPSFSLGQPEYVTRRFGADVVILRLQGDQGFAPSSATLYYASADCSGQGYLYFHEVERSLLLTRRGMIRGDWLMHGVGAPIRLEARSSENRTDFSQPGTCSATAQIVWSFESKLVNISSENFVPPFRVE